MAKLISGAIGILTMLYPIGVYFGMLYLEPWKIASLLFVLLGIRLLLSYSIKHWSSPLLLIGMLYCVFAIWSNEIITLRFYPVIANAAMLMVFSWSLFSPQSLIERLAKIQHPNLPLEGIIYTRRVTQIWCIFFIFNGGIALITALWSSFEVWSLYNGLIAYILMGTLFLGEYLIRIRTQKYV